MDKAEWFLQEDIKKFITETLGKEPWIIVYQNVKNDSQNIFFYSALIPDSETDEILEEIEFDFMYPYFGLPATEIKQENQAMYLRFGVSSGLEPLILVRDFHGVRPSYAEVSQEFVHFHNLYYDGSKNRYIKIYDDAREEDVIVISENEIKIRLKHMKQFLAFKDMCLGIYFETTRFINVNAEELGLSKEGADFNQREGPYHFGFWYRNEHFFNNNKAFSRLLGKKLIVGMRKEDTGIYPFEEEKKYQEFIIGQDENARDVVFICNPDKLANFFGKNPEAPQFVTPVFFSKDVLRKYYDDPDKFSVEDGYITIGASFKWADFERFSHFGAKMGIILTVLPHIATAPALAKKQIYSKWGVENAFPLNLVSKWEKRLEKTSTNGYIRCGGLWGLRIDNHHDDYVIVLLGDLGYLSHDEQLYWRHFNISASGTFSETIFKRYFLAEFAEPETVDLVFANRFEQVQEKWNRKFGWSIFKPLNEGDEYHFTGLRVPLKNTQVEFDSQVLSLTKVIIDSLNEHEIRKSMAEDISSLPGISKLEKYFVGNGYKEYEDHIKFLRNLQELRSSGSAHRKSDKYKKISEEFRLGKKNFIKSFTEILQRAIAFLDYLENTL